MVPDEGDHYWNQSGDVLNPQWCVSATATLQSRAAQDVLGDADAHYNSVQSVNSCTKYFTQRARSYEVPSTSDLEASYALLPFDFEVDARHDRLGGTVSQTPPFNPATLHGTHLHGCVPCMWESENASRSPPSLSLIALPQGLPCVRTPGRPMSSRALCSARSSGCCWTQTRLSPCGTSSRTTTPSAPRSTARLHRLVWTIRLRASSSCAPLLESHAPLTPCCALTTAP